MYRTCDLEDMNDKTKTVRRNISENNAIENMGIRLSDMSGTWIIKRVHGYSIFSDI